MDKREGGREGCTVFVLILATGLLCVRHESNRWKGPSLPHTQKKEKRPEHGADCTVTNGEKKKKKSAKKQRSVFGSIQLKQT